MDWQDFPGAPPTGTMIPHKGNEITDGAVLCTSVGDFKLILTRRKGRLRCYINSCPHQFMPLDQRSDSILSACGDLLRCSNHSAGFALTNGVGVEGHGVGMSLIPVPIIENDQVITIAE